MPPPEDPLVQGDEPIDRDDSEYTISGPTTSQTRRNKGPSRCYNASFIVVYFVLLIVAVVALGSFGRKEAEIIARSRKEHNTTAYSCILFTKYHGTNASGVRFVHLHTSGLCGYVFWGLTSITVVAFVWLIYSVVQAAIGPKV